MKAIWARNTPYSQLLLSVGIILLSAVLFTIISTVIASSVYGISPGDLQKLMTDYSNPLTLPVLRVVQTLSSIGTFIVPPLILAFFFSEKPIDFLHLRKRTPVFSFLLVIFAMLAATPFINWLSDINQHMHLPGGLKAVEDWMKSTEEKAAELTKLFLDMKSPADLFLNLIMIALIPAIGEELLFRGIVQKLLTKLTNNIHLGVWLAAILFSAMHMQFYGFFPRMILGAMLGYMLIWTGSLWIPIVAHFVNNAGAVIFTYLYQTGASSIDPDKVGTGGDILSALISLGIVSGLFYILKQRSGEVRSEE